jgi:hypothetical protein
LGRQCTRLGVLVEALEERILRVLLEHELGFQGLGETAREARLADADRSFDDDVTLRRHLRRERARR